MQTDGLFGAPEITVIIGQQVHSTLRKSLGLVGLGRERVTTIPSDTQGRLRHDPPPNLVADLTRADSLAADAHKWLNVIYDCGIAFVTPEGALRPTFAAIAGYMPPDDGYEAMHHTPPSA